MNNNVTNSTANPPLENNTNPFTIVLSTTIFLALFSPITVIGNAPFLLQFGGTHHAEHLLTFHSLDCPSMTSAMGYSFSLFLLQMG